MIHLILRQMSRFWLDRRGASAVEYTLLIVGIGVSVMAMIDFVSTAIVNLQTEVTEAIQDN